LNAFKGPRDRAIPQRRPGDRRVLPDRRSGLERRSAKAERAEQERRKAAERRTSARRSGTDRRDETSWQQLSMDGSPLDRPDADVSLVDAAADARTRAQAHYSHFMVGAALETADGVVIGGCNIENATYGLTLCAERVALVKALSDGHSIFTRLAVVADTDAPTPPCGPCRQLLWEYCGDIDIILGNLNGPTGRFRLSALLPMPFDRRLLG
jgi:cytidine deaminase